VNRLKLSPSTHHRRSIRLREYDYSWAGWYYVTVCAHKIECVFGEVVEDQMQLSRVGKIIEAEWLRTPGIRPGVELDDYVIMPNHLHGIVIIGDTRRGVSQYAPTENTTSSKALRSPSQNLGAIIRGFKSATTKRINLSHGTPGNPVWQRNTLFGARLTFIASEPMSKTIHCNGHLMRRIQLTSSADADEDRIPQTQKPAS